MSEVDSLTLERLRTQVEFYFSDSNFRQDKFLREKASLNPDAFVSLEVLLSFNRIKNLTTDVAVLSRALKDSSHLVLSEDEKMIRRADPLPEEDTSVARSIYVKRFPLETTLDELTKFFSQFGKVNCIRMRRQDPLKGKSTSGIRPFKGSVIVEFAEEESAKKVLEKKDLVFKSEKSGGEEAKEGEKEKEKEEEKESSGYFVPEPWEGPLFISSKEDFLKEKGEQDQKGKNKSRKQDAGQKRKFEEPSSFPKGCLVSISGFGDVDRFNIKETFEAQGNAVSFVEVMESEGDGPKTGVVRMSTGEGATDTVKKLTEDKVEFGEKVPEYKILEGEEEEKYWEKISQGGKAKSARGGRGGRGGRGRGRGRGGKRQRSK